MLKTRSWLASVAALTLITAGSAPLMAAPPSTSATAAKETEKDKPGSKAKYKSQTKSASKSASFATISASDKSVTGALKATDLEGARKLTDKEGIFTGTVTKVFAPKSNSLVILNFASDYHTAITATIRQRSFGAFPPLSPLEGKTILFHGTVTTYQNRPEIELTGPSQIKIVK